MPVEMEHRITTIEDRTKSNAHRIEELEKRQNNLDDLVSTVRVLATREENVENDVKEIKKDVKDLTNKPVKRWEGIVEKIIMLIVAAIVGYILAQLGLQ